MDLLYWSRFIQDVKEGTPFFVHADWDVAAMDTRSLQFSLSRVGVAWQLLKHKLIMQLE